MMAVLGRGPARVPGLGRRAEVYSNQGHEDSGPPNLLPHSLTWLTYHFTLLSLWFDLG